MTSPTILDEILAAMWADLPHVSDAERTELLAAIGRLEAQR